MTIKELPKVELHLHLDGSINPQLAYQLALKDQLIDANENYDTFVTKMVAPRNIDHLWQFLKCFDLPIAIMQSKENIQATTQDLLEQLIRDHVVYAEIRYAPGQHIASGLSLSDVMETVVNVVAEFNKIQSNCKVGIIHCLMIDSSLQNDSINWDVVNLTANYLDKGVVGIDLAGPEGAVNMEYYEPFFALANKLNIPFTIHAGEVGPASNVAIALRYGAKRIGHGGNCILDDKVVEMVKANDALLEMCLSSNVQCKNQPSYKDHPLKPLLQKGVKCCLNCDNRTLTNISLTDEYQHAMDDLDLTMHDLIQMNIYALQHAFMDNDYTKDLIKQFTALLDNN